MFMFEPTHSYTNLHNSIEEAGVTKVIYAFDRDQGAVDGWALALGWVSVIWWFLLQLDDLGWCSWNTEKTKQVSDAIMYICKIIQ